MSSPRPSKILILGVGLALAAAPAFAQSNPSNANLSTGSGAGTSPGVNPGSSPSSTRSGRGDSPGSTPLQSGNGPNGAPAPSRGGAGIVTGSGMPAAMDNGTISNLSQEELDAIDARILGNVRAITLSDDRALAMERVARAKLSAHQVGDSRLDEAHVAIEEGGSAALSITDVVTRDIRLTSIVRTALALSDELAREGMTNASEVTAGDARGTWTIRRRLNWLIRVEAERAHAAELAARIENSTLRSEMLFRVVDDGSQASQNLAQQVNLVRTLRTDLGGMESAINRMADRALVFAVNDASRISKPIWRDRALVSIATSASASDQFERGIQVSRSIPQPEYRSDALIRLAEAQARRNLSNEATRTYGYAAQAVASIPIDDPRATLASVLIDSLISTGRFDDARACVSLYPDSVRRLNALGTIAENQGERRLTGSALAWIDRDVPPELRDQLRLRVTNGVLKAFEKGKNSQNQMDARDR